MRSSIAALMILGAAAAPALAGGQSGPTFDWSLWRSLPVQDGGRQKPLDTLARETVQKITGRTSLADPKTGRKLGPLALYLTMLLDWREGQKKPPGPDATAMLHSRMAYFESHQADHWDRAPLLPVDSALREVLSMDKGGIDKGRQYISPLELSEARVEDSHTHQQVPFPLWAGRLVGTDPKEHPDLEKAVVEAAVELVDRLWSYQNLRMGQGLEVLPVKGSPDRQWLSVAQLVQADFDDQTDPTGGLRRVKQQFEKVRAAYLAGSPETFDQAATAFIAAAEQAGPRLGTYPSRHTIRLELAYNQWAPFRLAWWFTWAAFFFLVLSMATRWRPFYIAGLAAVGASLLAMLIGLGMRMAISGRAPVTNLYESVVFMALGAVVFGLVFGLLSGRQYILAAGAVVATIALLLADYCPSVLDPGIHPLQPVLRSNFWLAVHVITIMLSYAALAVALGIGNITLGFYLVGSQKTETIKAQCHLTYQTLKVGVLLLIVGTILGALWADYSWGRFWGWDPKEVWALITLLSYLAALHARYAGWVGNLGLTALSVLCFTWVVMAWYGVNLLNAGLHNYGLSTGSGALYVLGAVVVQLLYVGSALLAVLVRWLLSQPDRPAPQPV